MLPIRQGLSHLANLLQRSLPLPSSKCAYSMGRSQGWTGDKSSRKGMIKQDKRYSEYHKAPSCYVQSARKFRIQTLRVRNPHAEWALFCLKMIYKDKFRPFEYTIPPKKGHYYAL